MNTKKCKKCESTKPIEGFGKREAAKDGRRGVCIDCENIRKLEWHHKKMQDAEYRERLRVKQVEYRSSRPGVANALARSYYKMNKEKCNGVSKRYYINNAEAIKERQRKYIIDNPNLNKARSVVASIRENGFNLHHWSYNDSDLKDVIKLTISGHKRVHEHLVYDKQTRMFRVKETGELLDSKIKHISELNNILQFKYLL